MFSSPAAVDVKITNSDCMGVLSIRCMLFLSAPQYRPISCIQVETSVVAAVMRHIIVQAALRAYDKPLSCSFKTENHTINILNESAEIAQVYQRNRIEYPEL